MPTNKKPKKRAASTADAGASAQDKGVPTVRTSIVLPQALDENLGVYGLRNHTSKSEIIVKLLIEFLTKEGYQPLNRPKLEVKY